MAFYLLVANILLLNLLIAIFNNTFSSVQANANQIWKFQRYYLVMEYAQRPVLIPPFIILNHVIHAIKGLYRWLKRCRGRGHRNQESSSFGLKLFLETNDLQKVTMFEERCVDSYLREKDTLLHASQEEKIRVMGDRMESVSCQLQDMYKESVSQSNSGKKSISSLDIRLTRLEEHIHKMADILHELAAPDPKTTPSDVEPARSGRTVSLSDVELSGSGRHRRLSQKLSYEGAQTSRKNVGHGDLPEEFRFTRRRLSTVAARAKKNVVAREKNMHVLARQSPYPESNQQRYPVPDFLVDWQESFPGYDPPVYTAQEVRASPPGADPDILHNTSVVINFNCLDEGINRKSHTGVIDVVNQLPRNPVGRTGIAGRGLYARWGPNHATHIVATRWKIGEDGLIVQKEDQNVLEFVAVKSPQSLKWAMPGGPMEVGESVSSSLRRILTKKVLVAVKHATAEEKGNLGQRVDAIIQNATEVYKGYMDTLRNTDNAWMETVTLHFHDETREILGDIEFEAKDGSPIINWQEVSGHINLRASHSFILHKVAELRNANV